MSLPQPARLAATPSGAETAPAVRPVCEIVPAGRLGYDAAVALMEARVRLRREGRVPDAMFLLEHDPVVTLGKRSRPEHLLRPAPELERRGIAVRECGRGGQATYHGPGQLVGYPVLALERERRDAHRFLRDLEETLIGALADLGAPAHRRAGLTGVWSGEEKVASIGVRFSRWITSHGFALNVRGEMAGFGEIVPCGIEGCGVTTVERLAGRPVAMEEAAVAVARRFSEVFGRRLVGPSLREIA